MNWFEGKGNNNTNDMELGYKRGNSAVLDHLVPLAERKEDVPAVLLQDEEDVNHEELACVRNAWQQATHRANAAQELWGERVHYQLEKGFARVVSEQTPTDEDAEKRREILRAIDEIVQTGLPDYPGLCIRPYGSYVSGLYSPSGDLDLSIEGTPTGGPAEGMPVKSITKGGKADLLRTVSKKLERRRLHTGWVERILHARVPILKFKIQGVDCDVSIGSTNAIFKAKAFKALAARERRFADMLRLVKAWAGVHGLNDAADGTFNSFALGLMLIFHLQTCDPPVLPPLHELFQDSCSAISSRPIHMGKDIDWEKLAVFQGGTEGYAPSSNRQGLAQLMSGFYNRFHAALLMWRNDEEAASVRASTWCGRWSYGQWEKTYVAAVEDPFDATDNCARTIGFSRIDSIVEAFGRAAAVMNAARGDADVQVAMEYLFKGIVPPELPPVPSFELRQCNRQRMEKMIANEAEGRRWRERTYARDNGAIARRRDSGNSGNGLSSPAGASPATSIRLPKFAQQKQGAADPNFRASPVPQPPPPPRPLVQAFKSTPPADAMRPGRRITEPKHSPAPGLGAGQLPLPQLPSQSIAQSGAAQHARSSPAMSASAGSGLDARRPPPGFAPRSGYLDAGLGPSLPGNQHARSHIASPYIQPAHSRDSHQAALRALPGRDSAAAAILALPEQQPQTAARRSAEDSASTAAKHQPTAHVPYYMPAQQANQALSDELKRMLKIGQSPASEAAPAHSASEHDHTGEDSAAPGTFASKGRRTHRVRRPAQSAGQGAVQSPSSAAAASHGSDAAAAPDPSPEIPGKQKRFFKARRQGSSHEQVLRQAIPVRNPAEAFVENNLNANAAERKPRKVIPVAVR